MNNKYLHDLPSIAQKLKQELKANAVLVTAEYEEYQDWGCDGNSISHLFLALSTLSQVVKNERDFLYSGFVEQKLAIMIQDLVREIDESLIKGDSFQFFNIEDKE